MLSEPVARAVRDLGFKTPTPIQAQALPALLADPTDFIGQAATGTGKTAAFGLPLVERADPAQKKVQGLVLCPTRELALQVAGQLKLFGKHKNVKTLAIYGGAGYGEQLEGLKRHPSIVVGTPGRLIDHIGRGALALDGVKTVVLDEADEMISMGFKEDLEKILQAAPRASSNIWLFSATMSKEVRRVADTYLRTPKQAQVNRTEVLSATVQQLWYPARESDKPEMVCTLVEAADDFYGLVFCQTKSLVMDLAEHLANRGYRVDSLHGDKTQQDRERTMRAFRERKVNLLVCTDVASRGLDVKELTHVINYSVPREPEVYVHRIGRTARSGQAGTAISLVTPSNRRQLEVIERTTKSKMKEGRMPTRAELGKKKVAKLLVKFRAQTHHQRAIDLLGPEWQTAVEEMDLREIIGRFLVMTAPEVFEDPKPVAPMLPSPNRPPHPGGEKRMGPKNDYWKKRKEAFKAKKQHGH